MCQWILPALIAGSLEHNTLVRIEHIAVGVRSGLSCPQTSPLQRERQTSNVDASFDLVLLVTNDVKTRIRLLKCGNVGLSRPRCNVFRQKVRSKKARKTWISEFSLSQMQQVGTIRRARENMNVRWNTAVGDLAFYVI